MSELHLEEFVPQLADLFRLDPGLEGRVEVDSDTDCWLWTGASQRSADRTRAGRYGRLSRRGQLWLVHRWVYRLLVGRIPEGHHVHHACGTSLCCNPLHLETIDGTLHTLRHNEEARRPADAA